MFKMSCMKDLFKFVDLKLN